MIPGINVPFSWAANATGLGLDEFKLMFTFAASYPLAGVLKRIPDSKPAYKNLFIIAVTSIYLVGIFDLWAGYRTIIVSSLVTYAIAKYIDSPLMPWIGFVFLMGHMSVNQLHRQFYGDAGLVDITGAQMVLVMKLSAFCWNVADGKLPDKQLSEHQKDRALKHLPSLLNYAGYVLFFPAFMIGPAFDYVDYQRWLETTLFELPAGVDPSKKAPTRKKRRIPRSGTPAMWKAGAGIFWAMLFLRFSRIYYPELLLRDSYMSNSFLRRVWYMYTLGVATRLKYYTAWSLTEGACILSGLGYNGVDPVTGKVSWDRLRNVNPWGVESAQNTRAYLGNWNINTNNWLRNYVYLRVTPRGKKPGFTATLATFVTSAFWHGFYPGYYLTFVLASFVQSVAKNCRRYLRPFFLDPATQAPTTYKPLYDLLSWLVTQFTFSFVTAPFVLLGFRASLAVWAHVYCYAIIGTAAATAFFHSPAKGWLRARLESRARRAGVRLNDARRGKEEGLDGGDAASGSGARSPTLGVQDIDSAMKEVRAEAEMRQRRGVFRNDTM